MSLTSETETFPSAPQNLLGIFLKFLRRPIYSERPHPSLSQRAILKEILRLHSLEITMLIPIVFAQSIATSLIGVGADPTDEFMQETPLLVLLLTLVLGAPLLEEMMFRLPLRFSALNISLPLAFIVFLSIDVVDLGLRFAFAVGVGLSTRYMLYHHVARAAGHAFYTKYIGWLIYGSALLFGALHLFNFDAQTYCVAPLMVMPQVIGGFFLAFIRLRHGFWWSVFSHAFYNFCVTLPSMLMRLGSLGLQADSSSSSAKVALVRTDYAILAFLLLFVGGGLFLCLRSVVQMIREWHLEYRSAKLSLDASS